MVAHYKKDYFGIKLTIIFILTYFLLVYVSIVFYPSEGINYNAASIQDKFIIFIDKNFWAITYSIIFTNVLMYIVSLRKNLPPYDQEDKFLLRVFMILPSVLLIINTKFMLLFKAVYICNFGKTFVPTYVGSKHEIYRSWCGISEVNVILIFIFVLFDLFGDVFIILWFLLLSGPVLAIAYVLVFVPEAVRRAVYGSHYTFAMWPAQRAVKRARRDEKPMEVSRALSALKRPAEEKPPPAFISENRARKAKALTKALQEERELMEEIEKRERELEALRRRKKGLGEK